MIVDAGKKAVLDLKAESDSSFNMFCRIKHLENVCHQVYARIEYEKRFNK